MGKHALPSYSIAEEVANSITHGVGVLFGIVGLGLLLNKAIMLEGDALSLMSFVIYGSSIIVLYLASTLYHAIPFQQARRWLKTFDHCAIYLLIAGTYTPFMLMSLRTPWAMGLMVLIWGIAIAGIVFKVKFVHRFKRLSLAVYLMMGWLSVVALYPLSQTLEGSGMLLLAAGGLTYSAGVVFYVMKQIPFNHAIWHLFVLAGTACHFAAIYGYVAVI
ncbi:PAQR family membrane homeostasis protein TrhA [Thaumasiovibrio sp. DFM-14]|uniref:PAQR family membrane homeostasis protein TrhA n=1 Tax=Thaumasiovibrio sp. DFM-14 TaxID=3384792 RepID=UPI0039A36102